MPAVQQMGFRCVATTHMQYAVNVFYSEHSTTRTILQCQTFFSLSAVRLVCSIGGDVLCISRCIVCMAISEECLQKGRVE